MKIITITDLTDGSKNVLEFRMPSLSAGIRELNTKHFFSLYTYFVYIYLINDGLV